MKTICHPAATEITVQGILHALSDPVRVRIFADILGSECAKTCMAFLQCDNRILPKSTLSQHFRVLREAGLIRSERKGVEIHNRSRCEDLEPFYDLIGSIIEAYQQQNNPKKKKKAKRA